jgi:hypothetical protein
MLYSITWEGPEPTLEQVCERFGFGGDEVDHDFGVVATDPEEGSYAILVEEAAVQRVRGERTDEAKVITGPFANPRIEPFDLQEPDET